MPCPEQRINITPSCIHPAENDILLPELIRGGHYIHYRHFCAVLGCEHAPYDKITSAFSRLGELVIPFPIQCRGLSTEIEKIIEKDPLLSNRTYSDIVVNVSSLLVQFRNYKDALLYGTTAENGYPIKEVLQAVAYIIADENELFGKRPKGYVDILTRHTQTEPALMCL